MKKIVIILSVITIISSGYLIVNNLDLLDIPSNKNEQSASFKKQRINNRTDINKCEKEILKTKINLERKSKKKISNIILPIQFFLLVIILVHIVIIILVLMMPQKKKWSK